jgi:hypothetical protein
MVALVDSGLSPWGAARLAVHEFDLAGDRLESSAAARLAGKFKKAQELAEG